MEEKEVRKVQIENLPKDALGIHKVQKVKILKTQRFPGGFRPSDDVDYAIVKLDNGVVFNLVPQYHDLRNSPDEIFLFSRDEEMVIMSEGESFEFVLKA